MLQRSTIQLLRFHFSFFLLPVYLFALSETLKPDWWKAVLAGLILHLLVYPSSNGYNSYMDRDEGSIGGIETPLKPTAQLFRISVIMDVVAIILSLGVSLLFCAGIIVYILASRAYSYRGIRLKKYPLIGYFTVMVFQGALVFFISYKSVELVVPAQIPVAGMLASSLLIGGFYPLTQIYQHEADRKDGVITISALLGYRGSFIFTALVYLLAMLVLYFHYYQQQQLNKFFLLAILMSPILVYFFFWAVKVWKDVSHANFKYTMKMNLLACSCTNLAFLILIIRRFS